MYQTPFKSSKIVDTEEIMVQHLKRAQIFSPGAQPKKQEYQPTIESFSNNFFKSEGLIILSSRVLNNLLIFLSNSWRNEDDI